MDYSLNEQQVAQIRANFNVCAETSGILCIVIQPTGLPNMGGRTRARVRVLCNKRDYRVNDVIKAVKKSAGDIFQSLNITVTHNADVFENSLHADARRYEEPRMYRKGKHMQRSFGYKLGRLISSGEALRLDF